MPNGQNALNLLFHRVEDRPFYYWIYGKPEPRKYMIIGRNPAPDMSWEEAERIHKARTFKDLTAAYHFGLESYFGKHEAFWKQRFLQGLPFAAQKDYLQAFPKILNDFYYTDVFKKREIIKIGKKDWDEFLPILKEEIDAVNPDFIFSFGKEALDALKWWCSTRRKKHELTQSRAGVKDLNGQVFQPPGGEKGPAICVLTHYSRRAKSPNIEGLAECLGDGAL